jgi:sugar phosphate isomerase/epimerase
VSVQRVLASTTSHKTESLPSTLEVFSKLGLRDLELNLHHLFEEGVPVGVVEKALAAGGQRVWIVSGGWCDFFQPPPQVDETFKSVDRQAAIVRTLCAERLRLFFGRLTREEYSARSLEIISTNLRRLADRYHDIEFVFENHDGASLRPEICREVLERVDRPNIRMNFDPINFELAGVNGLEALRTLLPLIGHVHLKGLEGGEFCEFGAGDVDLIPVLRSLLEAGYQGSFTVEYEGRFDKTLRLYQSVETARTVLRELAPRSAAVQE